MSKTDFEQFLSREPVSPERQRSAAGEQWVEYEVTHRCPDCGHTTLRPYTAEMVRLVRKNRGMEYGFYCEGCQARIVVWEDN